MIELKQVMKGSVSKLVLAGLSVFFIYCFFRPAKIVPSFLKNIISLATLDTVIYPVILIPFIISLVLIINMAKYVKKNQATQRSPISWEYFPIKSMVCFLGSIAVILVLSDVMRSAARDKFRGFLDELSADVKVTINGQTAEKPNQIIAELKKIVPLTAHHSHTTKKIRLEVANRNETLRLVLGRDSRNAQEYWVFYPKYRYTSRNEIGRINTTFFDDY